MRKCQMGMMTEKKLLNKDDMDLVFYGTHDGMPNMADSYIIGLLVQAEKEGSLDIFFFGRKPTGMEFLAQIKTGQIAFGVTYYKNKEVGIGILDKRSQRHAHCHICAFSEWWGNPMLLEMTGEVYRRLLKTYTVLIGVIPVVNVRACKFVKKSGMKELCDIPGYFYDEKNNEAVAGKMLCIERGD